MTDTQEKDLHFIVEESSATTTNGSVVSLSRSTMNSQNIWSGVTILLKGKQSRNTAVTVLADEDDNMKGDKIRMNATVRSNLGVTVGDLVQLGNVAEKIYGKKVFVRPVSVCVREGNVSTDLNSTDLDLLRRENLLEAYVRPYFLKAYRPVHQGDIFIVDATVGGSGKQIKFKVIETSPSPFCIVGPGTNIEISLKPAATLPATGDLIQGISPLPQEAVSTSTRLYSNKRNCKEGSNVPVENKRNKTDHLVVLNASSNPANSIECTASTSKNNASNAKDSSGVNQNQSINNEAVQVQAHSKAELQALTEKLRYIHDLIVKHSDCFVNPQLSQLQNWSTKFLKLEQDLHDESRNTATTNAFCELLKDSALEILIKCFVAWESHVTAMKMCEVMLTQMPIFLGLKIDVWFWLYYKVMSLSGSGQGEHAVKLLDKYEQEHNNGNGVPGHRCKEVLKAKYSVGCILNHQVKSIQALPILQSVYAQQIISLGSNDSETLKTSFEIGKCLMELKRDQEALSIFQSVYEKWNLLSFMNHEDIYNVQIKILHILMNLKRYDEVLTMAEKIYQDKVNSEGPQHSRTLVIQRYIRNCVNLKKKE